MKYRNTDEVAKAVLEDYPDTAHMYVLERILTGSNPTLVEMWRQVLTELDRLQGENKCED